MEALFLDSFEGDYDDDAPWAAVRELRRRNTPKAFKLAVDYSKSKIPLERARALDVLAQLGSGRPASERSNLNQIVEIAKESLGDDDPIVVRSAAWALSHVGNDGAISALVQVRDHPDPDVRQAVAAGVAGTGRNDSIQTLIELMDDTSDVVRDWATFGLGTQCSEDSDEIRKALKKRLDDTVEEARNEAIWGLARRKDRTGLQLLLGRLETNHWSGDETTAADILGIRSDTPVENLRQKLRCLL